MTRDETKKILMVVQAAYPHFNPPDKSVTIDTWCRFLEDYTYDQVNAAVGTYIRSDTSGFAPDIGKVIEKLQMLFQEDNLNEMAAWGKVFKAIRNSGYHAEEEFAGLPEIIQKAVGSPGQLREWALAENVDGTWMNVTQSNFMRSYRAEAAREKELRKLPPEVLKLVGNTVSKCMLLEEIHEDQSTAEEHGQEEEHRIPFTPKIKHMLDDLKTKLTKG